MTGHAVHAEDDRNFDYAAYANALNKAVTNFFKLQEIAQQHFQYVPSIEQTEDLAIDLGLTLARLRRDDVPEAEKKARVKAAGSWLRSASRTLNGELMEAIKDSPDETDVGRFYAEIKHLQANMVDAGALQDQFEELFDPKYVPWQAKRGRSEHSAQRMETLLQRACTSLQTLRHGLAEDQPSGHVIYAEHLFTDLCEGLREHQKLEAAEKSQHAPEVYWRAENVLRDEEQTRAQYHEMSDSLYWTMMDSVPKTEYRYREIIESWRRDFRQEINQSFASGVVLG